MFSGDYSLRYFQQNANFRVLVCSRRQLKGGDFIKIRPLETLVHSQKSVAPEGTPKKGKQNVSCVPLEAALVGAQV